MLYNVVVKHFYLCQVPQPLCGTAFTLVTIIKLISTTMIHFTILDQEAYNKYIQRLEFLKNTFPQTKELTEEIRVIEEELIKFKIIQNCIRNN